MGSVEPVSVTVISYNAEQTIEETLDSIRHQDLGAENIELLVSDDGSGDNTVAVVNAWLSRHAHLFRHAQLIANEVNGGVSRNCNIVWQAATTAWVKTIAADDILLPDCLSANLDFVAGRPGCDVVFSKMRWFGSIDRVTPEPSQLDVFDLPALDQYKRLRYGSFNFAPTSFIRRAALESVGYADEQFRNIEDLPLWLKFSRQGHKLWFMDRITVRYRVSHSISKSSSRFVNLPFLLDLIEIHRQQSPLADDGMVDRYLRLERSVGLYSTLAISKLCGNRRSALSRSLELLALLLRPVDLWGAVRRRLHRYTAGMAARAG